MNNELRAIMKKHLRMLYICLGTFALVQSGFAQSFQNLDFEAAHNIPVFNPQAHPWSMPAANALPGWTCYIESNVTSTVFYNDVALDSAQIGLQASDSPYPPNGLLEGQYCASLQSGVIGFSGTGLIYGTVTIAQLGEIPFDAQSIRFTGNAPFAVTIDGNAIPMLLLDVQSGYNVYSGDIGQFAGQVGELSFTSYGHFGYLDSIQFSSQAVPEPSTSTLILIGAGVLWRFRARST